MDTTSDRRSWFWVGGSSMTQTCLALPPLPRHYLDVELELEGKKVVTIFSMRGNNSSRLPRGYSGQRL
jgi:hypothetical protein